MRGRRPRCRASVGNGARGREGGSTDHDGPVNVGAQSACAGRCEGESPIRAGGGGAEIVQGWLPSSATTLLRRDDEFTMAKESAVMRWGELARADRPIVIT